MRSSAWNTEGDFSRRYGREGGENCSIYFVNHNTNCVIQSVALIGWVDGGLHISIKTTNDEQAKTLFLTTLHQHELPINHPGLLCNFRGISVAYASPDFHRTTDELFGKILTFITQLEPSFDAVRSQVAQLVDQYADAPETWTDPEDAEDAEDVLDITPTLFRIFDNIPPLTPNQLEEIIELIEQIRGPVLTRSTLQSIEQSTTTYLAQQRTRLFSLAATSIPQRSQHALALSELTRNGFDENTIPGNFLCSLSREIMDDPVFDPHHPQYKFDRASIERSLNNKNENPFTRTPLMKSELLSDTKLKSEIESYVQSVYVEMNCGLKF